jgi:hypothetical protein
MCEPSKPFGKTHVRGFAYNETSNSYLFNTYGIAPQQQNYVCKDYQISRAILGLSGPSSGEGEAH